jgi:acid phosphatase
MKPWLLPSLLLAAACGSSSSNLLSPDATAPAPAQGDAGNDAATAETGTSDATAPGNPDTGASDTGVADTSAPAKDAHPTSCAACPTGYMCGSANGIPVCRAPSGIPLFSNVFVIMMENTSLATLSTAMKGGQAPNLAQLAAAYASGSNYHGVAHPSLPNYIALTSGDTQGITCDCAAAPGSGSCSSQLTCNLLLGSCSCAGAITSIADQLETANLSWMDFGEDMGTPCNLANSGNYAVRHNPFLYYNGIQTDSARCNAHVVDFKSFSVASPPVFTFIAPNLVDDMHNPDPTNSTNIPNGDAWIGPEAKSILGSTAYGSGSLFVIVWDEDDGSGGITGTDDPIEILVMSPYAKANGFVSQTMANHYSLLATFEDGLGLPRLGNAASATPLTDYFPAN